MRSAIPRLSLVPQLIVAPRFVAPLFVTLALFGLLVLPGISAARAAERPNVLLIMTDDIDSPSSRSYRFIRKSRGKKPHFRRSAALQIADNPGEFA